MFGFGKLGDMMSLLSTANQQVQTAKDELKAKQVHISVGTDGATVEIFSNGLAEIERVAIAPELLDSTRQTELESLVRDAMTQLAEETKSEFKTRIFHFAREMGLPR